MALSDLPLHFQSITEVAELIRTKQISPVELTKTMLDRIDRLDPQLHGFAHCTADQALEMARQAESDIHRGQYKGQLHGIPVAVKDLCYTRGIPTKGGLRVRKDFIPEFDATVILKLKSAGAILLGKLTMTEGAVGGYHRDFPIPKNPWDKDLWTGSSSSGSGVAVSAGLCFAALGSDTGGSIRFPAMACGVTGLKPAYGMVSRYGILPLAETLDHVGPMTRTVQDAAITLDVIAGPDRHDATTLPFKTHNFNHINGDIKGIRIGYDPDYASAGVDKNLLQALNQALDDLKTLGVDIIPLQIPDIQDIRAVWKTICTYEAAKAHSDYYPAKAAEYGAFFGDFLEYGYHTDAKTYQAALQKKKEFSKKFLTAIQGVDLLACPGAGIPCKIPPDLLYKSLQQIRSYLDPHTYFQFTIPANFTGLPSLSFPCGLSAMGPPYTLQLVAAEMDTATLCRVGHAYQQATSWHRNFPKI